MGATGCQDDRMMIHCDKVKKKRETNNSYKYLFFVLSKMQKIDKRRTICLIVITGSFGLQTRKSAYRVLISIQSY